MVRRHSMGFSLVELMVALGILSALVMGSVSLFSTWVDYKKILQASTVADQSQLEISTLLAGDTQCTTNLGAAGANVSLTTTLTSVSTPFKDSAGASIFTVGSSIGHAAQFEAWSIIEKANLGPVGANTKVMADLLLSFKTLSTSGATSRTQRKISLIAVKDPTNKIVACDVLSASRDPASLGGGAGGIPQTKSISISGTSIDLVPKCDGGELRLMSSAAGMFPSPIDCSGNGWDSGRTVFGGPLESSPFVVTSDCSIHQPQNFLPGAGGNTLTRAGTFTGTCPAGP